MDLMKANELHARIHPTCKQSDDVCAYGRYFVQMDFTSSESLAFYLQTHANIRFVKVNGKFDKLPNLGQNIETCELFQCQDLEDIESLTNSTNLTRITIAGCGKLKSIPKLSDKITEIVIMDCPSLEKLDSYPRALEFLFVVDSPNLKLQPTPKSIKTSWVTSLKVG